MPKKYIRDPRSLIWECFCKYFSGCQSPLCHFLWSQYHLHIQQPWSSSHPVFAKTQVIFLCVTEAELLNRRAKRPNQWRLFQTIEWLLQPANLRILSLEQQSLVVALYKSPHQKYHWERHSWFQLMKWPVVCCWHKSPHRCHLRDQTEGIHIIQFIRLWYSLATNLIFKRVRDPSGFNFIT